MSGGPLTDLRPSTRAAEIADALRGRVDLQPRAAPEGAGLDARQLDPLGDLEAVPATAKPGPLAIFVRTARRVLQVFLRPWLAAQTIYNRELARRFDETNTVVHDLERRTPLLEHALHELESRLLHAETVPDRTAARTPDRASGAAAIGAMFLHSRLPRPPARVLVLESDEGPPFQDAELVGFGFTVFRALPLEAGRRSPRSSRGDASRLPFRGDSFDAVLRLRSGAGQHAVPPAALGVNEVEEIARVLRPGGRLIAIQQWPSASDGTGAVAAALRPLEIAELLRAGEYGGQWRVVAGAADVVPGDGEPAMLLIDARRPDASPR